ncbi:MAG: hypothetical protein IKG18_01425 [Atopobiaceae bacterium]|nr:hypothetical protein [Atopobiaceae bacterium]
MMTKKEQRIEMCSWLDMVATIALGLRERNQLTEGGMRELDAAIEQAREGIEDVLSGKHSL